jgi:hypothetical protein
MKTLIGLAVTFLWLSSAWAQPSQVSFSTTDSVGNFAPLDSFCGGTTRPIADGTIVQAIWDRDPAGPSFGDTLLPLEFSNYNMFTFNGEEQIGDPSGRGNFWSPYFIISESLNPPRIYLQVCLSPAQGNPTWYTSRSITLNRGIHDDGVGQADWVCLNSACNSCPWPHTVNGIFATDSTRCDGVFLSWMWEETDPQVDSFYIFRDWALIRVVDVSARSYFDSTAIPGNRHAYGVASHNSCGRLSAELSDWGSVLPMPQTPVNVTASTDRCESVLISWAYTSSVGIDSFFIRRNGIWVGTMPVFGPPGVRTFTYGTGEADSAFYEVEAYHHMCGVPGSVSAGAWGTALQRIGMLSFTVSQGLPDSTVVNWIVPPGATRYAVHRANSDGAGEMVWEVSVPDTIFVDYSGARSVLYRYWVVANNICGVGHTPPYQMGWRGTGVGVNPSIADLPREYSLEQNYPNPFNPATRITYALPKAGNVTLTVCEVLGRTVAVLVQETQAAGMHTISFDGEALPSGVYLYRLKAESFVQTRKMVLMK